MAKENYMINRKKRILFYILMAAVLCWFVVLQIFGTNERDKKTIEQNIEITKSPEQFHLKRQNVKQGLKTLASDPAFEPLELVFMDPPYRMQEIVKDIEQLQELNLVSPDCVIVCEVDKEVQLPERILEFEQYKRVEYGITALVFFDRASCEEEA